MAVVISEILQKDSLKYSLSLMEMTGPDKESTYADGSYEVCFCACIQVHVHVSVHTYTCLWKLAAVSRSHPSLLLLRKSLTDLEFSK